MIFGIRGNGDLKVVKRNKLSENTVVVIFFALVFLFPVLDKNSYHQNVGVLIGIFSIIAIGLNLLLGNTGKISLGHAAFFGIGAYTSAVLTRDYNLSFWLALPPSAIFSGAIGYMIGLTSLRLRGHYLAMATLAFGIIAETIFLEWTEVTGGTGGFGNIPSPTIGSFQFKNDLRYFYLVWIFVLFISIISRNLVNSRIGRALHTIHMNEEAAAVIGINPTKYKLKIFGLSAAYGGLAGSLFANFSHLISAHSFSIMFSVTLLSMIVVGGLGSVWGSITGAILLTLLEEFIRFFADLSFMTEGVREVLTNHNYHLVAYGILMLICIVFMPNGVFGAFQRVYRYLGGDSLDQDHE